jgi:hypothetical protein
MDRGRLAGESIAGRPRHPVWDLITDEYAGGPTASALVFTPQTGNFQKMGNLTLPSEQPLSSLVILL